MASAAEAVLQKAAEDGSLDSAEWPDTLQYILDRLDEIINDFPKPTANPNSTDAPSNANTPSRQQPPVSSQESTSADKENAPPSTPPTRPPVPAFSSEPQIFPQETINFYTSIRTSLSSNFSRHPPHTVQRLAELILEPKKRYRFLPAYLRALDRVVCVSSPLTLFPLPQAVLPTAGGLLNGATSTPSPSPSSTLGSDESLGGALLTPIPWLQNRGQNELISESTEMVDGPNGAGRIETVTVGMLSEGATTATANAPPSNGAIATNAIQIASSHPDGETLPSTGPVTQGEILRQEQEAGVVLNNPHSLTNNPNRTTVGEVEGGGTVVETVEGEEEVPHARGPEIIGMEDTGPQKQSSGGLDIEGAVGRPSIEGSSKSPGPAATAEADAEGETESKDMEMKDASEKGENEKTEEKNEAAASATATEETEKPDEDMKTEA